MPIEQCLLLFVSRLSACILDFYRTVGKHRHISRLQTPLCEKSEKLWEHAKYWQKRRVKIFSNDFWLSLYQVEDLLRGGRPFLYNVLSSLNAYFFSIFQMGWLKLWYISNCLCVVRRRPPKNWIGVDKRMTRGHSHTELKTSNHPKIDNYSNFGSLNRFMTSELTYDEPVLRNRDFSGGITKFESALKSSIF